MRIPKSTRTKDDANKELHSIELQINEEKSKLEQIVRKRHDAEIAFSEREKRNADLEKESVRELLNIKSLVAEKSGELKDTEHKVSVNNRIVFEQNTEITNHLEKINSIDKSLTGKKNELNEIIEKKQEVDIELDKKVKEKDNEIKELGKEIKKINKEKEKMEKTIKTETEKHKERKKKIEEKEKDYEEKKSDLRIIESRLNKKYGEVASKSDLRIINK